MTAVAPTLTGWHPRRRSAARIALPRFTLRTNDVVLKTLTAGKVVRIDGLASSRV